MTAYSPLDIHRPRIPTEADLVRMMCRHIPYIEQYWYEDDTEHGHFGSLDIHEFRPEGGPINEMVIRSMVQELQGYAALYMSSHFDEQLAGLDRPTLLDRLNRCLRWICAHHLSGSKRTEPLEWEGAWGDDWESSPWTADMAMAANHVWDHLDADVGKSVLRVLAFEADRFLHVDPPDGRWLDTKAEENAWDSYLLAWAYCLQPDHPNAEQWLDRGKCFAANTFTTDLDRVDTRLLDDRPVKDWVCTQTAHPDLTVENHGSFHPGYLGSGALLLLGLLAFQKTGQSPPPHYMHHVQDAWTILRRFFLSNGFTAYPSGQDWTYHEPDLSLALAVMYEAFGDRIAGHMLWHGIRHLDAAMDHTDDGRFNGRTPPASGGRYFQFETGFMGQLGCLTIAGLPEVEPVSDKEFRREQTGTEAYPYVWLQVRRSRQGLFSFTWRSLAHSVMGMVIPAGGENILGSDQDAFTGRFEIAGKRLKPTPVCHTDHTSESGFRTTGLITYVEGRIRQSLAVVAFDDGETALVVDRTEVDDDIALSLNEGLGIYVMNDSINDNRVRISYDGGRRTIKGVGGQARVIETGSTWIKVAGCLGIETDGIQLCYEDASERNTPARWKSLLQDRVFVKPESTGPTVRDYACVVRQGKAGTRRVGAGIDRLETGEHDVRAFRLRSRTGKVITVTNFTRELKSVTVLDRVIEIPPMDTVVLREVT